MLKYLIHTDVKLNNNKKALIPEDWMGYKNQNKTKHNFGDCLQQ